MSDRAFLCGINAYHDAPLSGCINDVTDMAEFLTEQLDFDPDNIRVLADKRATTKAIMERLHWLVRGAKAGDRLVFHFSGHGVQIPVRNDKAEVDGLDEALCPYNFDWENEVIRDDDLIKAFSTLPDGVKLLWVSDSCHSGDSTRGLGEMKPRAPRPKFMHPPADIAWRFRAIERKGILPSKKEESRELKGKVLPVTFFSGCKSTQTSADAWFGDRPNGALTKFLLQVLSTQGGLSAPMSSVLKQVRLLLKQNHFTQVPQLEGDRARFALPLFG